jgi:chorismate--pyruvate lyase
MDPLNPFRDLGILQREIIMWGEEKPCWYACTLIPQETYESGEDHFRRLEHEPLGNLMYHSPKIHRCSLTYGSVANLFLKHSEGNLCEFRSQLFKSWFRFSTILWDNQHPFFLTEILWPDLMEVYSES